MSEDHKPNNPLEQNRIELAGGKVQWKRVDGDLAVSRGLGDFQFKTRVDLGPTEQKVCPCNMYIQTYIHIYLKCQHACNGNRLFTAYDLHENIKILMKTTKRNMNTEHLLNYSVFE